MHWMQQVCIIVFFVSHSCCLIYDCLVLTRYCIIFLWPSCEAGIYTVLTMQLLVILLVSRVSDWLLRLHFDVIKSPSFQCALFYRYFITNWISICFSSFIKCFCLLFFLIFIILFVCMYVYLWYGPSCPKSTRRMKYIENDKSKHYVSIARAMHSITR